MAPILDFLSAHQQWTWTTWAVTLLIGFLSLEGLGSVFGFLWRIKEAIARSLVVKVGVPQIALAMLPSGFTVHPGRILHIPCTVSNNTAGQVIVQSVQLHEGKTQLSAGVFLVGPPPTAVHEFKMQPGEVVKLLVQVIFDAGPAPMVKGGRLILDTTWSPRPITKKVPPLAP